jgi:uncharacterized membrane protein YhhN
MPVNLPLALILLSLAAAALDWLAVAKAWKRLEYLAKPAVMLLLLAWLLTGGLPGALAWFALGAAFSLAGDVFLMLPKERFTAGLAAFLLAHLAYIVGLNQAPLPLNPAALLLIPVVALPAGQVYRRVAAGLERLGKPRLRLPVLVYTIVISLMLLSALLTLARPVEVPGAWQAGPSLLVSGGALLFYLSDALLAWNRFVGKLPSGRLGVHLTYHLGQIGLLLGAALHSM